MKKIEAIFSGILIGHMAGAPSFIIWSLLIATDPVFYNNYVPQNEILFYGSIWGPMVIGIIIASIYFVTRKKSDMRSPLK